MPKIEILELDQTTPGSVIESTDIVFIPGFVNAAQSSLTKDGEYVGLKANEPHLFTDVTEFETLCGAAAPTFADDQKYSTISGSGFKTDAIPTDCDDIMIEKGTPDPSYVMAKELLAAGIGVLYQRVNVADQDVTSVVYTPVTENIPSGKPAVNDVEYFYKDGNNQYCSYKDAISYPEFNSFIDKNGAITVYSLNPIETYAQVKEYYNSTETTYYVIDGNVVAGTEDMDPSIATFKNSVLVKGKDGAYTVLSEAESVPETLPDEDAGLVFAIPDLKAVPPENWKTDYTKYFEKQPLSEGSPNSKYVKIAEIESNFKTYESGNIFVKESIKSSAFTIANMYAALADIFKIGEDDADQNVSGLIDKGNYSVKYLTSGGYPVFECSTLANAMLTMAETRGDCVALIDHTDYPTREMNPYKSGSLYQSVLSKVDTDLEKGEFGAMFTPWATFSRVTTDENHDIATFRAPGSFAYLLALADSIKTNANWLAIAGAARGGLKNLYEMTTNIPNGVADAMQKRDQISINAITNIKPYGYTIWGNRTLKNNAEQGNLVATSFLNVRNLVSDVKKTCYRTARKLTFEQDTDVLWINFKSEISKLLEKMKSGYGISGYKIVRDTTHDRAGDKATLCAKVILYPTYAVEDFYITIVLKDDEVKVD